MLGISECLGAHESLHIGGVSVLRSNYHRWTLLNSLTHSNSVDLACEQVFHVLSERLEVIFVSLGALLRDFFVFISELETLISEGLQLVAIELSQVLEHVYRKRRTKALIIVSLLLIAEDNCLMYDREDLEYLEGLECLERLGEEGYLTYIHQLAPLDRELGPSFSLRLQGKDFS